MAGFSKFPAKVLAQLRLLSTDPQQFFSNRYYSRHPLEFERKLLDIERFELPNITIDPAMSEHPSLNVMLPAVRPVMTGGPNTAVNMAVQIAASGVPVRLVAMDEKLEPGRDWFRRYLRDLTGSDEGLSGLSIGHCCDPEAPLPIGSNDMFLATYWTTASRIGHCLRLTNIKEFIYLIQDFEPAFYPWSSNYALALATYDLKFRPIINESMLADFLRMSGSGRFADPGFIERGAVFEPAVDRRYFYSGSRPGNAPRRLLFYARPGRNMRGLGFEALRLAAADPVFAEGWEFQSLGSDNLPVMTLSNGKQIRPAPWMAFSEYAKLIRESDILLCLMLSPHTSYPSLEMVASGGITITNTFATKTKDRLQQISSNIIAAPPDSKQIAACLVEAGNRITTGHDPAAAFTMPRDWPTALAHVTARILEIFQENRRRKEFCANSPTFEIEV